jgi:hypothetical protein
MGSIVEAAPSRRSRLPLEACEPGLGGFLVGGAAVRDREIVRWIGRLGAATLDQVRARFGLGRTVAYRRVAACIDGGLLDRVRLLHGQPALLRATSRGLRYAGLALPVARLSPELFAHWLTCAWVEISLASEPRAPSVVTERELRFHERRERRPIASANLGENPGGSPRLHRPDLVLAIDEFLVAVEVELTPKAPSRLEGIVRAWCRARCIDAVRYYAAPGATMRGLERAVERVHADERVELRRLDEAL